MPNSVSVNICRPTLRGVDDCSVENSWFPLWLIARHQQLTIEDKPQILFFGDIGNGEHLLFPARTIRIFLTGENIAPNWREADYALTHQRLWNKRHWRSPLWRHFYDPGYTHVERDFSIIRKRVDRFCNFIYSNSSAKNRIEFFERLNFRKPVDSGGRLLNNVGSPIVDKKAYLARCKFTIAFENESHPGYATEKIIEPLLMGSIPIYWGDPQIEDDFNPDCLINVHRFRDFDAVIEHVLEVDNNIELWKRYVTAPIFRNNTIPDNLSNSAYITFINNALKQGPQVHPFNRAIQSLNTRFAFAKKHLQDLTSKQLKRFSRYFKVAFR
jgi:hypothetical protein